MLLDCWAIPCVIFLTWIFLKTRYRLKKFIGVGICVAGLVTVIFSDVHADDRTSKYMQSLFVCFSLNDEVFLALIIWVQTEYLNSLKM